MAEASARLPDADEVADIERLTHSRQHLERKVEEVQEGGVIGR
jgi:hypothetical protein